MAILCEAAITDGIGNIVLDGIEILEPGADEVLVQIKAASLCHTGYDSLYWGKPMILGYEGSGIIVKTGINGSNVKKVTA